MTKVLVISNDKFFISKKKNFFNSNKNTFTILNSFKNFKKIYLFCRSTKKKQRFKEKIKNNIEFIKFKDLFNLLKEIKNLKILIISLTPFSFFISLVCIIFGADKKNIFLFLRSDGFLEYKAKFGNIGYIIYGIMFYILKNKTKILSCSKFLTGVSKSKILFPSEIDSDWLKNRKIIKKKFDNKKIRLLYIGRFREEKGYLNLINIFKDLNINSSLRMVGNDYKYFKKKFYPKNPNIKISGQLVKNKELIKCYDNCDIFILPSYAEAYPQVILESLSRLKPVIVFNEIKFLKKTFSVGVYSSPRNTKGLQKVINMIIFNYSKIQNRIFKQKIFTQENFFIEMNKTFNS